MNSFKRFWGSKKTVAAYVDAITQNLKPGSVLTTITTPAWLGGFYVHTAIDASSAAIAKIMGQQTSFSPRTTISHAITPVT